MLAIWIVLKFVNPFPNKPLFLCVWYKSLEIFVGIGEIALLFNVLYPMKDKLNVFNCRTFNLCLHMPSIWTN